MKKVILLATAVICLLFSKAHAQQTSFENNVKLLSNKIDLITKEEKESLKKEVEEINEQLQKGQLTAEQAELKKQQSATTHAKNIENRVAVVQAELKQLIQDKVEGKIEDSIKRVKISVSWEKDKKKRDSIQKETSDLRSTSQLTFAFGLNNLVTNGSVANSDFGYLRSAFFEWGITGKTRIMKNNNLLHFKYGGTFVYNYLSPTDNRVFVDTGDKTELQTYPIYLRDSKSHFKNVFITVPLHLEFDFTKPITNKEGKKIFRTQKSIRFGIGGYVGYNINSKQYIGYDFDGYKYRNMEKGNWNVPDFNYGLSTYVGYKDTSLYLKYDLNPMFKNNTIDQRNISLGLRFDFN